MKPLSLRARLTLWYTFALVVVLGLFGADVLWQQERIGLRRVDRELDAFNATLANVVRDEILENPNPSTAADVVSATTAIPGRALAILDARGTVLAARWNGLELASPLAAFQGGATVATLRTETGQWRVHIRRQVFGDTPLVLVVASPLSDVQRERHEVEEAMVVGIPIVLLIAAGGGLWLASVGLRPLTEMAHRAARIPSNGMEDLGHVERTDELGQLAGAFNGLVARLRAALQTQRQFMADASHEIRTPVSVVRATADVTLSQNHRDEAEYREALTIIGGQARRLGRLVDDMAVLARADAGGYPLRPVDFYLDELVAEGGRTASVRAAERGVTIQSQNWPEIPFRGDEDLLRQLVVNVLHNAVQHTPPGSSVGIEISQGPASVQIRVRDAGPGIPVADQERIFDRFVQLDRARRTKGSGLGLPIARWIAEAHHGTLVLEVSGPDGSTFCLTLPTRADEADLVSPMLSSS